MLEKLKDVQLGKGLGPLSFGQTREQVLALLGEPTEREKYTLSELDNDDTEAWHYDDLDLSLSFDQDCDWTLSSIAVSSDKYLVEGEALIGRTKEDILRLIESKGWGEPEEDGEVRMENPANSLLHIDKASMSLWFEENELTELQLGPFYSEADIQDN